MNKPIPKPKKKKKKKNTFTKELWEQVYERDNWCCILCGTGANLDPPHHIKYRSQGGTNELNNLVTLCIYCHAKVHTNKRKYKPILENYIKERYDV